MKKSPESSGVNIIRRSIVSVVLGFIAGSLIEYNGSGLRDEMATNRLGQLGILPLSGEGDNPLRAIAYLPNWPGGELRLAFVPGFDMGKVDAELRDSSDIAETTSARLTLESHSVTAAAIISATVKKPEPCKGGPCLPIPAQVEEEAVYKIAGECIKKDSDYRKKIGNAITKILKDVLGVAFKFSENNSDTLGSTDPELTGIRCFVDEPEGR